MSFSIWRKIWSRLKFWMINKSTRDGFSSISNAWTGLKAFFLSFVTFVIPLLEVNMTSLISTGIIWPGQSRVFARRPNEILIGIQKLSKKTLLLTYTCYRISSKHVSFLELNKKANIQGETWLNSKIRKSYYKVFINQPRPRMFALLGKSEGLVEWD